MLARLLVPALAFALVGCIPTGKQSGCGCGGESPAVESTSDETCPGECEKECCQSGKQIDTTGVDVKAATVAQIDEAVAANKGKVVLVHVWSMPNDSARANLFRLKDVNDRLAGKGLVAMTVSIDEPKEAGEAVGFLARSGAKLPHYRLEDEKSALKVKWEIDGGHAVLVFDRQGKLAGKFIDSPKEPLSYEGQVEPLVAKLIDAK